MISAAEANKKTTEVIKQGATVELQEISKEINIAISKGLYQINRTKLSPTSQKALAEMGYKVESGNHYNNYYYFIKW